ncbi:MAG: 2-succinyl-5-enolpyruvyl-6-hydroxy-3-cyclohexene-1-carboxylic-acid synthase, partial [Cyanothece sp. SIO1E1]|nr:2-succinyl-5-enolpyruvyl-6-hydroxy-3-cyclohexene-1-carboxylic-acid synthase [Cyanothece sp. SIO1E1]
MPTSKTLRQWLASTRPRQWIVDEGDRNLDPLHGRTTHLYISAIQLASLLPAAFTPTNTYLELWRQLETQARQTIDQTLTNLESMFEGKIAWFLSQQLQPRTPLFIANSMPVRDVECFWPLNQSGVQPFFNRGANGIDGTLSTALGVAHRSQSTVLLTGDLALLHDTNGFLLSHQLEGHLTIVLINNNGGGIFETLPIARFNPPFEEFFAMPQKVNFSRLCATYQAEHQLITSWEQLKRQLNLLPQTGLRILEICTDRKADSQWRHEYLQKLAEELHQHSNYNVDPT